MRYLITKHMLESAIQGLEFLKSHVADEIDAMKEQLSMPAIEQAEIEHHATLRLRKFQSDASKRPTLVNPLSNGRFHCAECDGTYVNRHVLRAHERSQHGIYQIGPRTKAKNKHKGASA